MMRSLLSSLLLGVFAVACGSSTSGSPPAMDPRTKNPCVTCTPESFCAAWSRPEDRRCATDADCIVTVVRFEDVRCDFGWYGGAASAVTSRAGEPRVRARMSVVNPCELHHKISVGSVCAAPPLECKDGLCGYKDGPPTIAF